MPAGGKVPTMARRSTLRSLQNLQPRQPQSVSDRDYRKLTAAATLEQKAKEKEAQKIARTLLLDPRYKAGLKKRLNSGRCQPGVEVAVWQYAFGKPQETIDTKQVVPVRIVHEYS